MADLRALPLPEFPTSDALAQLQQTPAPGPAVARALGQLPDLAPTLVEPTLRTLFDQFPYEPNIREAHERCTRDLARLLKMAALNLVEADEGREAGRRHAAVRAMFAGSDLPVGGESIRLACRLLAEQVRDNLRGPGAEALSRELGRIAVAVTAETPPLPMLAHVGTANPPRYPTSEELAAVEEKVPELGYVTEAARQAAAHEAKVVEAALARVGSRAGSAQRPVLAAMMTWWLRAASNAFLRGDTRFAVEQGERWRALGPLQGVDLDALGAGLEALGTAIVELLDPWTAGLWASYVRHVGEGLLGATPRYPDRRALADWTLRDPLFERAVAALQRNETKILADTLAAFLADHRKFLRPLGDDAEAKATAMLRHVLRAAMVAALTDDLATYDHRLDDQQAIWRKRGLPVAESGTLVRTMAVVTARTCPDAGAIAAMVEYAAEVIAGEPAPLSVEPARNLAALLKREAKVARAAADEAIRAFPRAPQVYGRDLVEKCARDEAYLLRFAVEAATTGDRAKFVRRVGRQRRVLDALGFPSALLAALFPALEAAAAEPELAPWFELGATVMDARPPRAPGAGPTGDPQRHALLDRLARAEEAVAVEAAARVFAEMPFLGGLGPEARALLERDGALLLRHLAGSVASGDSSGWIAHVRRHASFAPRVGVPRAALRRSLEHAQALLAPGLAPKAASLLDSYFRAAGVAATSDPRGHETMRHLLETFEGRFPEASERALLAMIDPACGPMLAALDEIAARSKEIAAEVCATVFAKYDYESAHFNAKAKCIRDIILVLAYGSHSMMLGSPIYFADKLLHWLRTIFAAFTFPGKGESVLMTYTLVQQMCERRLSPGAAAMFRPYTQAALDILPAPGIGAKAANAAHGATY